MTPQADLFDLPRSHEKVPGRSRKTREGHIEGQPLPSSPRSISRRERDRSRKLIWGLALSFSAKSGERPAAPPNPWEDRRRLEAELGEATALWEAAEEALKAPENRVTRARRHLELVTDERLHGQVFSYEQLLPLYEDLRIASFEAHPFRLSFKDADTWRRLILEELKHVNKDIERAGARQRRRAA
jgi:hypothetical protein